LNPSKRDCQVCHGRAGASGCWMTAPNFQNKPAPRKALIHANKPVLTSGPVLPVCAIVEGVRGTEPLHNLLCACWTWVRGRGGQCCARLRRPLIARYQPSCKYKIKPRDIKISPALQPYSPGHPLALGHDRYQERWARES
jgi:hypothetical protein